MKPFSLLRGPGRRLAAPLSLLALLAASPFASAGAPPGTPVELLPGGTVVVYQGAVSVDLYLSRPNAETLASVTLNTDNGTPQAVPPFAAALAGMDYVDLTGPATEITMGVGEFFKTVTLTLIPKTGTAVPNKRFTATISNPGFGATLGANTTTTIQILANDTTAPTLTVTAPAATATTLSTPLPYLIKGTAGDMRGLDRVEVEVNDTPVGPATLGAATSPTAVPYSLPVTLLPGANTIEVIAYDLRGNSKTVTRAFTFTQRYTVSLHRVAPIGIAVEAAGTVGLSAMPAGTASSLTPPAAAANPKTATVVSGSTVKLSALPKPGYTFSHWDGLPLGYTYLGNYATFTMPAYDLPPITAHFVVNPFHPVDGQGNLFYGTLQPPGPPAPGAGSGEGFVTGSMTPAFGLFTGKVLYAGVSKSFISYFYGNGSSLFNIGSTKQPYLPLGGGNVLSLYYTGGMIHAAVIADPGPGGGLGGGLGGFDSEDGGEISPSLVILPPVPPLSVGILQRAAYGPTNLVPASLLNFKQPATASVNNKGYFTLALPAFDHGFDLDPSLYPQGAGVMTLTLSNNGTFTFAGTLADGTGVTGASGLVGLNLSPIFAQLAVPGAAAAAPKLGSLGGLLVFAAGSPDSDITGPPLRWIRPAVTPVTTPAAAAAATNLYTDGWPTGIFVNVVGALYDKTVDVQTMLNLGAPGPAGNGMLAFSGGKLTSTVTKTNFNISGNVVTKLPATDATFSLAVMPATGAFSGSFAPNWSPLNTGKPMYKGILLQKGPQRGFGYFLSNIKNDLDPESGAVSLGAPAVE